MIVFHMTKGQEIAKKRCVNSKNEVDIQNILSYIGIPIFKCFSRTL